MKAAPISGITTSDNDVKLIVGDAAGENLSIEQAIVLGSGDLFLRVAGNITQTAPGTITAVGLALMVDGTTRLELGNDVDTLAADNQDTILFNDIDDLTVGTVTVAGPGQPVIGAAGTGGERGGAGAGASGGNPTIEARPTVELRFNVVDVLEGSSLSDETVTCQLPLTQGNSVVAPCLRTRIPRIVEMIDDWAENEAATLKTAADFGVPEADRAGLHAMYVDEGVMATLGGVKSAAETDATFQRLVGHWDAHDFGYWMLRDPDGDRFAGRAGLRWLAVEGEPAPAVGRVNVRANPGNCTVTISGISAGSPPFMNQRIVTGTHEVVFTWPDGTTDSQTITVESSTPAYFIGQKP